MNCRFRVPMKSGSGHFAATLGHERSECNPRSSVNSETVGLRIGSGWRD